MKHLISCLIVLFLAVYASAQPKFEQYPLTVYVRDGGSGEAIMGAEVYVGYKSTVSVLKGEAHFNRVNEGKVKIRIERDSFVAQERSFNISRIPSDNVIVFFLQRKYLPNQEPDITFISGKGLVTDEDSRPLSGVRVAVSINNVRQVVFTDTIGMYQFKIDRDTIIEPVYDVSYIIHYQGFIDTTMILPLKGRRFLSKNLRLTRNRAETFNMYFELKPSPVHEQVSFLTSGNTEVIRITKDLADGMGRILLKKPKGDKTSINLVTVRPGYRQAMMEIDVDEYLRKPQYIEIRQKKNNAWNWMVNRSYLAPGLHSLVAEKKLERKVLGAVYFTAATGVGLHFFQQQKKIKDLNEQLADARSINSIQSLQDDRRHHRTMAWTCGLSFLGLVALDFIDAPKNLHRNGTIAKNSSIQGEFLVTNLSGMGITYRLSF